MRSGKHARIPPTREIFIPASRGTAGQEKGNHHGYLVHGDTEYAQTEFYVPHDYDGFVEAVLVLIAYEDLAEMTMRVTSNYCAKDEVYNLNVQGPFDVGIATGTETLHELDISNFINGDATVSPIQAGDYVGVEVERVAGQNTNALILGVRFRYKVFKFK